MSFDAHSGIVKARFRAGLPGRQTTAVAQALINSLNSRGSDVQKIMTKLSDPLAARAIPAQASMGDGDARHQARMAALDPQKLVAKAKRLGYDPLEISGAIRTAEPAAPMASVAERGAVVLATAAGEAPVRSAARSRTKGSKRSSSVITVVPEASVAPAGRVIVATEAPAAGDFCAFLEHYAAHTKHGRDATLLSYLRKQYDAGSKYNPATKRFTISSRKGKGLSDEQAAQMMKMMGVHQRAAGGW